jgi:hypothetical protein
MRRRDHRDVQRLSVIGLTVVLVIGVVGGLQSCIQQQAIPGKAIPPPTLAVSWQQHLRMHGHSVRAE